MSRHMKCILGRCGLLKSQQYYVLKKVSSQSQLSYFCPSSYVCRQNYCSKHNSNTKSPFIYTPNKVAISNYKVETILIFQRPYCTEHDYSDLEIDYTVLKEKMSKNNTNTVLIDVREANELIDIGSFLPDYPSALNIPLREVADALSMSPKQFKMLYGAEMPDPTESEIIFSCAAGIRSMKATMIARELGYENAKSYRGGIEEWIEVRES